MRARDADFAWPYYFAKIILTEKISYDLRRYFCTRKLNSESKAPRKIATVRERMITITVYWSTVF